MHHFFEYFAPVLVASELIEAGTGGSKKNNVAGFG
jgi:hypothetical protein